MTLVTLVTRNRALEREFLELLDSLTLKFLVSLLHRLALPWFSFTTKEHEENSLTPTPQARNSARIRKVLFVHSKDRSLRSDPK